MSQSEQITAFGVLVMNSFVLRSARDNESQKFFNCTFCWSEPFSSDSTREFMTKSFHMMSSRRIHLGNRWEMKNLLRHISASCCGLCHSNTKHSSDSSAKKKLSSSRREIKTEKWWKTVQVGHGTTRKNKTTCNKSVVGIHFPKSVVLALRADGTRFDIRAITTETRQHRMRAVKSFAALQLQSKKFHLTFKFENKFAGFLLEVIRITFGHYSVLTTTVGFVNINHSPTSGKIKITRTVRDEKKTLIYE